MMREDAEKLRSFNRTAVRIPFEPIHEQIRRQAKLHPEKTAVICAEERLSFRALDERSDRMARELIRRKKGKNDLVGILLERSCTVYIAEVAILKAGAAFLPFIPEYPDERIHYCMQNAGSTLLLTSRDLKESGRFRDAQYEVVAVEELPENAELSDGTVSFPEVAGEDLAYCIYTSGTTGRPKGALIEHRNIANFVNRNEKAIDILTYAEPGRISLAVAPFSFDFSIEEGLVPLCNGNTVVIATPEQIHDPAKFRDLVCRTDADAIACTPTYLCGLLAVQEGREALQQLKLFHVGGEAFPEGLYTRLRGLREDSVIVNVYGPTECTVLSSVSVVTGEDRITVGRPRANVEYHVLDGAGKELAIGETGELIICGAQVGRGYVRGSQRENAFFTYGGKPAYHSGDMASWTETGEIMIHGRVDNQIKYHGYRIELEEIESVMTGYSPVDRAAVVLRKEAGSEYLAGYFTAKEPVDRLSLKNYMKTKLPDYMIPKVFMSVAEMPRTVNGKIDRRALPAPDGGEWKERYVSPVSEEEKGLCRAMEKVLHRPARSVGLTDDFFDLSGDSVSAMELLAEAGMEGLTYDDIFAGRTPSGIIDAIRRRNVARRIGDHDRPAGDALCTSHALTPVQKELLEVQRMVPHSAMLSAVRFLMRLGDAVDPPRFCDALNRALVNHPGLSVRFFPEEDGGLRQRFDPSLVPKAEIREISPREEDALSGNLVRPFDRLLDHSLCRVQLFQGQHGLYFFMDVHHLLVDGLSLAPLLRDIADAYHGKPLQKDNYPTLLALEEEKILNGQQDADRTYLLSRYGGYEWCVLPFTVDPGSADRGAVVRKRLRFGTGQVRKAVERLSVSFSVMHIAAILLAMYRTTGKKDVMTFWTFHNRQTKEAENAVGMFIKTLPVGCHMDEIHSVMELLLSVKEQVVSGITHSAYSYLVEQVFARRQAWVESNLLMNMGDDGMAAFDAENLELKNAYDDTADNVALAILSENEEQKDGIDFLFSFQGRGISAEQVERFHRRISDALEAIVLDETGAVLRSTPKTD